MPYWPSFAAAGERFLGRRKSQSEDVDLSRINAELFSKIRLDKDGPEFDDAEAGRAASRTGSRVRSAVGLRESPARSTWCMFDTAAS